MSEPVHPSSGHHAGTLYRDLQKSRTEGRAATVDNTHDAVSVTIGKCSARHGTGVELLETNSILLKASPLPFVDMKRLSRKRERARFRNENSLSTFYSSDNQSPSKRMRMHASPQVFIHEPVRSEAERALETTTLACDIVRPVRTSIDRELKEANCTVGSSDLDRLVSLLYRGPHKLTLSQRQVAHWYWRADSTTASQEQSRQFLFVRWSDPSEITFPKALISCFANLLYRS